MATKSKNPPSAKVVAAPASPAPASPTPASPAPVLTPGTPAYKIGVIHIDLANSVIVVEFVLGIVSADGSFVETRRANFSVSKDAFVAADVDMTWVRMIPDDIAPLYSALNGIAFFGL